MISGSLTTDKDGNPAWDTRHAGALRPQAFDALWKLLAPALNLPGDCTGITLTLDWGRQPELEVRRIVQEVSILGDGQ